MSPTLAECAVEGLTTADARSKADLSRRHAEAWFASGGAMAVGRALPPDRPARPAEPVLLPPKDVPRRRPGTPAGRIALLHAVAHIELNAVDLHWDIVVRFAHVPMPRGFHDDWVRAAGDEARHFLLPADCLAARGSRYARCRRMPSCGVRPRIRRTTFRRVSPSCPWCSRRADST